jgi:uncharacterized membrane protein YqgA involved in biofilm formation
MSIRSFLDRFVHPRLAAITTIGVALWILSFLIAAVGLAIQAKSPLFAIQLFLISSVIDIIGIVMVVACTLWLVGLRTKRFIRS